MSARKRIARIASFLALSMLGVLMLAPQAMAADGVGLWGRTDDLVVTLWAFGVMAFLTILVTVLTVWQIRAENRRERARTEIERTPRH